MSLRAIPFERAVFAAAEAIAAASKTLVMVRGRTLYDRRIELERGWLVRDPNLKRLVKCRIRVRITLEADPFKK